MSDKIIGFNSESDFDRMSRSVHKFENMPQVGQQQRANYPTGVSGGGREARIRIIDVDTGVTPKTATAVILGYDRGVSKAPGQNDNGEITVVDKTGCNLVTPYDDLICKQGYARYMYDRSTEEKTWEIVSLDCPGERPSACNLEVYLMNNSESNERNYYDTFVANENLGILVVRSLSIGGAGARYTSGCVWESPRFPDESDDTNQFIEFLKSGRSIIVAGEQLNRPPEYFWGTTFDQCIDQADCDAINEFYASIGGLATISPADLVPPAPATDTSGVKCFTGGIAADPTHKFCVDGNGDQNVFFFEVRGSGRITANGSEEFIYAWDSGSGTDSSKCLMAGNQYPAPGAGWVFLLGDADIINGETYTCYGPDMSTMIANICRNQVCLNTPS